MKLLIMSTLTIIPFMGIAQTGPGGVGKSDGTSNLDLWLKADIGVTTSDNLRFTLDTINSSQTPLPIELLSSKVKAVNNNV